MSMDGIAHTMMTREQAQQLRRIIVAAGLRLPEDLEALLPGLDTPAEPDGRVAVTVRLKDRHMAYLTERGRQHGESPARHLETVLLEFRAYHDARRPDQQQPAPSPGMPVTTRRGGL